MQGPLTIPSLTAKLFRLLHNNVLSIKTKRVSHGYAAFAAWEEREERIRITVDPAKDGLLPSVIHELCHIALQEDLGRFAYSVEEPMIHGLEREVWSRIHKNRKALERWRKEINSKLT